MKKPILLRSKVATKRRKDGDEGNRQGPTLQNALFDQLPQTPLSMLYKLT